MIKKLVVVMALALVVCTFAGCTTSTTNQTGTSNATSTAATTHDALFEKFLTALKTNHSQVRDEQTKSWEVTWINTTSARVVWTEQHNNTNQTRTIVQTVIMFPTSQDATNYVNALNKTAYSLNNTIYSTYGAYLNVTGRAPQTYKVWQWEEGNPNNITNYTKHTIELCDNFTTQATITVKA